MSNIITFSFESTPIRAIHIDNAPWFIGRDICNALGYLSPSHAIRTHCKNITKYHPIPTTGGIQEVHIINEIDTYRLITNCRSPQALRFETWFCKEMLPTLRKTNHYNITDLPQDQNLTITNETINILTKTLNNLTETLQNLLKTPTPLKTETQETATLTPPLKHTTQTDPWYALVTHYSKNHSETTLEEICRYFEIEPTFPHKLHLSKVLRRLNWSRKTVARQSKSTVVYYRPPTHYQTAY